MQLYEEPPESKGSYILQGEDPHSRNLSPPLASMRLPSPSETAAQRKGSGGSSPSRWGNTKADAYGAATANGTASQQAPISLRRGAGTEAAHTSQGEDINGGNHNLKRISGKSVYPSPLASMRLPPLHRRQQRKRKPSGGSFPYR